MFHKTRHLSQKVTMLIINALVRPSRLHSSINCEKGDTAKKPPTKYGTISWHCTVTFRKMKFLPQRCFPVLWSQHGHCVRLSQSSPCLVTPEKGARTSSPITRWWDPVGPYLNSRDLFTGSLRCYLWTSTLYWEFCKSFSGNCSFSTPLWSLSFNIKGIAPLMPWRVLGSHAMPVSYTYYFVSTVRSEN